jgi:aspartate-semialdehyde dehydrogenase
MDKSYKVAVVGATSLVGREVVAVLDERGFPVRELVALASERSVGQTVELGGTEVRVAKAEAAAFAGVDLVLMVASAAVSRELAPLAAAAGAVVVDASSAWRADPDVPMVVPEVNPGDLAGLTKKRIVCTPDSVTIQVAVALAPLHQAAGLKRVVVSTYQAASGRGKRGMEELGDQVRALFNQRDLVTEVFPRRLAFNCIPQVDAFMDDGWTREERDLADGTRRVLHAPALGVFATCVRVPTFNGHSATVIAELERPLGAERARAILREAPGIMLMDAPAQGHYPTPTEADGSDATFVGRVRDDPSAPNALSFWCVADNVRKGAATTLVQLAELMARDHLAGR